MKKIVLFLCIAIISNMAFAQTATLKFSARTTDMNYVRLNSVQIKNTTQDWEETIEWPDTMFVLSATGIADMEAVDFNLLQNVPNPFDGKTSVALTIAEADNVTLTLFDLTGRQMAVCTQQLAAGTHRFNLSLASPQTYFLSARTAKHTSSIKLSNLGNGGSNSIAIAEDLHPVALQGNLPKYNSSKPFVIGDNMTFVGHATVSGTEKEVTKTSVLQPGTSTVYFDFEPVLANTCPGTPTVTDYDGNVYNTVQIGDQCWMRENLKTTHFANGDAITQTSTANMANPTYTYPNNMSGNANAYGLLYNWPAAMHGASSSSANPSGVQGVCPDGWHVPSDAEWQEMEIAAGVPEAAADSMGVYRGTVAATLAGGNAGMWTNSALANVPGNLNAANRNSTGFTALPAGVVESLAAGFNESTSFWTATLYTDYRALYHLLHYAQAGILRSDIEKAMNCSVRCVKD